MFSFIRKLTEKCSTSPRPLRRPRRAAGSVRLEVDALERREVYAAAITASLGAGGVLYVEGTQSADKIGRAHV